MKTHIVQWTAALALGASALSASGGEKPLWEAGLGVSAISFPDYRGSSRQRTVGLPLPYFVYRGKFLRADRGGLRGKIFDGNRVKLDISLSASLPVESDSKGPRRGMPDLQPTVEFGPLLAIGLWRGETRNARLDLRLPVRAAYAFRGGAEYAGIIFAPALGFNANPFGHSGWNLGLLGGPVFANARQHKYFYDVAPRYALPGRPAYSASGGYSGAQLLVSLSKRFENFWLGGFVRYDALRGAAFDDSPLLERKHVWAGGLGLAWILGESSRAAVSGGD
ncbi:MAG: MipA/OmpV family protein [Azoarcus sp.]|jgi:outer membrane scaffolding protein for murein synthesis (MipA/OmpV family)|nr:MipA/OmpV family protein [Azoarcus sp.]